MTSHHEPERDPMHDDLYVARGIVYAVLAGGTLTAVVTVALCWAFR